MADKIKVLSEKDGDEVIERIFLALLCNTFCVVSIHSAFPLSVTVLENAFLKDSWPSKTGDYFGFRLRPRRKLGFDLSEKPEVEFISAKRIDIIRHLPTRNDTLRRIILIK